ncbi:hypothetical protein [Falsiroseomonas sp. CW058]|uniref:hypothetical protein n=1 Tax=Falsiroseomonas sp. CW058 TaxID=3388664 RepID=UPI003D316B8F
MSAAVDTRGSDQQELWVAQLRRCFDAQAGLFARQIRDGAWAPVLGTEAITSTAICLIGLDRAGIPVEPVAGPAADLLRRAARQAREQAYPGGLGLVLWAGAATRAAAPLDLLAEAGLDPASLEAAIPAITTMEVAWLVSGLLHADHPALANATAAALRELQGRQGPSLAFRHASAAAPLRHRVRARVANFADQVYPLQALAFAAIAQGDASWLKLAERAAGHLVGRQGPLGQWWWHHDALTGRVVEPFPVYSVHQHSMAPMALRALSLAGGTDHAEAVRRSRAWLSRNELGIPMEDPATGIVWRSIERAEAGPARLLRRGRIALARPADVAAAPPALVLNREMRPYEWGWLLYARAIEESPRRGGHIA